MLGVSLVVSVVLAGCSGDDDGSASESGSSESASTGNEDVTDDGGEDCGIRLEAMLCPEQLAAWIDDGTMSSACGGASPGDGTGGPTCGDDPPMIDAAAAEALCDEVCGTCSCELGSYSSCSYAGLQADGKYMFECNYSLGCSAGGCGGY